MNPDVLVVDDEESIRNIASRWLLHAGYRVEEASGADEAVAALVGGAPQVLITDVQMPGHDGLWLARQIRARFPDTALVMVSGDPSVGPAIASARLGAFDYLIKPFTVEQLTDAVDRAIRWREARLIERLRRAWGAHDVSGWVPSADALDRIWPDVLRTR